MVPVDAVLAPGLVARVLIPPAVPLVEGRSARRSLAISSRFLSSLA
jgi:hypothetical protein